MLPALRRAGSGPNLSASGSSLTSCTPRAGVSRTLRASGGFFRSGVHRQASSRAPADTASALA